MNTIAGHGRGSPSPDPVPGSIPGSVGRFWPVRNILSMRSVMRKPPTTLMVAAATAMKPRIVLTGVAGGAGRHQRPDQRDGGDRVGGRHERRVQERRHPGDDLEADETGQDEDVELDDGESGLGHDGMGGYAAAGELSKERRTATPGL